ncbi:MAG: SNARE Bet1 [Amphiamblys sp. WSBS2006]|nr:MAG: SNARE Bet1 [Amphiamblys sp. WSBS2006]
MVKKDKSKKEGSADYSSILEEQNEEKIAALQKRVGALRQITKSVHKEVQEHNKLLDMLDEQAGETGNFLNSALGQLNSFARRRVQSGYFWQTVLFCLLVFVFLYLYLFRR